MKKLNHQVNTEEFAPRNAKKASDLFSNIFDNKNTPEGKAFDAAFNKEQKEMLRVLILPIVESVLQHIVEDEAPHFRSISKLHEDLSSKLRNHRHELGKTYSGKPEF